MLRKTVGHSFAPPKNVARLGSLKILTPSRVGGRPTGKGRLMQTKQLGNSDLKITPIGLGAWAMGGGGWQWSWGPQDDDDSITAIHEALDHGINWIDTAAVYGLGHSEEVVARALRGSANRPYIFTKAERVWDEDGNISGSL